MSGDPHARVGETPTTFGVDDPRIAVLETEVARLGASRDRLAEVLGEVLGRFETQPGRLAQATVFSATRDWWRAVLADERNDNP